MIESQLAEKVVHYFEERGFVVYHEVVARFGRADIVAVNGPVVAIVEVKTSMGLALLSQTANWVGYANLVYAAAPYPKERRYVERIAREQGFGLIGVDRMDEPKEFVAPRFHRGKALIRKALHDEQRTFSKAGNAGSKFWSPWQGTCREVRSTVKSRMTIADLVARIKHHYGTNGTARACLTKWIECGKIPGVRLVREGKAVFVEAVAVAAGVSGEGS